MTGGTRGIAKGIAAALAREGARLAIADRSNKAAQNTLRELQAEGDRYGLLDILVNKVGKFRWRPLAESTLEEWREILNSNLLSVLYASKAALPAMRRQRWGRIINLGAVGAERAFGQAKISAYAAAKTAVMAFSRSLAEAHRVRDARFPIGRPPTAEDMAAAVLFFASEKADYVTGQVLNVSGGWML
jgi:NAD(P)-dependent dehydrogenase (short-subunit alcohol dehydrogenase family)